MDVIRDAFSRDAALCDRILAAARQHQDQLQLFVDISRFLQSAHAPPPSTATSSSSAPSKKRKLDDAAGTLSESHLPSTAVYSIPDTSFSVPMRKKLTLRLLADADSFSDAVLVATAPTDSPNQPTCSVCLRDVDQVFCLPVPEKAARQWNVVVFPRDPGHEQVVFTLAEAEPTTAQCRPGFEPLENDTYVTSCMRALNKCLSATADGAAKKVVVPSDAEFASAVPQSHRKGEKAWHVKAHRGSKDGFLFFLSTAIVWAFKKPLALLSIDKIQSISYTSVLQRTFNLLVVVLLDDGREEEIEFAMLDQADYAGINEYVQRHGLNDASLAAERRAKRANVNGKQDDDGEGAGEEDGETELQKAERELQDREDDEEEDYDPTAGDDGSDDDSASSTGSGAEMVDDADEVSAAEDGDEHNDEDE